jgi:predicted nucleotidyltransferase
MMVPYGGGRKNMEDIKQRYLDAVDSFIDKLRDDQNVIAVILCGSLSYDKVWEKSDIDLTVVVRDQQLNSHSY